MSSPIKYQTTLILPIVIAVEVIFWIVAIAAFLYVPRFVQNVNIERPWVLWGMLVLPLMMFFYIITIRTKNKNLLRFSDSHLLKYIVPDISSARSLLRYLASRMGMAAVILAIAGPQLGTSLEEVKTEGVDVMIAVDVSNSMLAQDLSPNRMEVARRSLEQLIDRLKSDRLGIVVFAGDAYTQLPITSDHSAAKLFLNSLGPSAVGTQGTAIGAAIRRCQSGFDMENGSSKSIVVITDGENHEDDAEAAASEAAEAGIVVHTIGMGSTKGAPIPEMRGRTIAGFKKDKEGNTVVSKLNQGMLEDIAAAGNGVFIRATNSRAVIDPLVSELRGMDQIEAGTFQYAGYEDQFQIFLGIGCLLLLFSMVISENRTKRNQIDRIRA
jgi:Ca-activated chloride channel family protein